MGSHFGEGRVVKASVQNIDSLSMDWKDEEVSVKQMIIIRPEDGPVKAGSRLSIHNESFRVVKAFPIPDERHPSHYELMLMSWGYEPESGGSSSVASSS